MKFRRSKKSGRWPDPWSLALLLVTSAHAPWLLSQPSGATEPVVAAAYAPRVEIDRRFSICGAMPRIDCVVDGDTFYLGAEKIRISDIDTPEVSQPRCPEEEERGRVATHRLRVLLNAGSFSVYREGRDTDRYGRKLRIVSRNGNSLGEVLISEGLAHAWRGRKESWCG